MIIHSHNANVVNASDPILLIEASDWRHVSQYSCLVAGVDPSAISAYLLISIHKFGSRELVHLGSRVILLIYRTLASPWHGGGLVFVSPSFVGMAFAS